MQLLESDPRINTYGNAKLALSDNGDMSLTNLMVAEQMGKDNNDHAVRAN